MNFKNSNFWVVLQGKTFFQVNWEKFYIKNAYTENVIHAITKISLFLWNNYTMKLVLYQNNPIFPFMSKTNWYKPLSSSHMKYLKWKLKAISFLIKSGKSYSFFCFWPLPTILPLHSLEMIYISYTALGQNNPLTAEPQHSIQGSEVITFKQDEASVDASPLVFPTISGTII